MTAATRPATSTAPAAARANRDGFGVRTDTFEIVEGQFVLAQSRDKDLRAFAQEMVTDHMRTREALEQAASRSGLHPPRAMDADQARMLSGLQAEKSPDLDRDYLTQQVVGHQAALAVHSDYAARGADANLRAAAAAATPVIRRHLDMAKAMAKPPPG